MFERVVGINIIIVGWVTSFCLRRVVFDRVGWLRGVVGSFFTLYFYAENRYFGWNRDLFYIK